MTISGLDDYIVIKNNGYEDPGNMMEMLRR